MHSEHACGAAGLLKLETSSTVAIGSVFKCVMAMVQSGNSKGRAKCQSVLSKCERSTKETTDCGAHPNTDDSPLRNISGVSACAPTRTKMDPTNAGITKSNNEMVTPTKAPEAICFRHRGSIANRKQQ